MAHVASAQVAILILVSRARLTGRACLLDPDNVLLDKEWGQAAIPFKNLR